MYKIGLLLLLTSASYAHSALTKKDMIDNGVWQFSGIVSTDEGNKYGYFFKITKNTHKVFINTAILNANNGKALLSEESELNLDSDPAVLDNIKTEHIFVKYNPVNERWVFGIKQVGNLGFSFKIDMLQEQKPYEQKIDNFTTVQIIQTGRANGHMKLMANAEEQFVTANRTWLQITKTNQKDRKTISNMLCQFNDGSGIYNTNYKEKNIIKANVTKFLSANGQNIAISQFIKTRSNKEDTNLQINIPYPSMILTLNTPYKSVNNTAGFFQQAENTEGFCTMDDIG